MNTALSYLRETDDNSRGPNEYSAETNMATRAHERKGKHPKV